MRITSRPQSSRSLTIGVKRVGPSLAGSGPRSWERNRRQPRRCIEGNAEARLTETPAMEELHKARRGSASRRTLPSGLDARVEHDALFVALALREPRAPAERRPRERFRHPPGQSRVIASATFRHVDSSSIIGVADERFRPDPSVRNLRSARLLFSSRRRRPGYRNGDVSITSAADCERALRHGLNREVSDRGVRRSDRGQLGPATRTAQIDADPPPRSVATSARSGSRDAALPSGAHCS